MLSLTAQILSCIVALDLASGAATTGGTGGLWAGEVERMGDLPLSDTTRPSKAAGFRGAKLALGEGPMMHQHQTSTRKRGW